MAFSLKNTASGLALSCAIVALFSAQAQAYTLMDMLNGKRREPQQRQVIVQPPVVEAPKPRVSAPLPTVSSPRYYTYKTEALRLIDMSKFADADVSGTVADTTGSTSPATSSMMLPREALMAVKLRANADVASAIEDYYGNRTHHDLWVSDKGVNDRAKAAMDVMALAGDVGLDSADYHVDLPALDPANPDPAAQNKALARFELALSAKILSYIQDTTRGRIEPNKISGYHDFKRKVVNLKPVLNMVRLSPDVGAYLESRNPNSPQFAALRNELKLLKGATDEAAPITINLEATLKPGDASSEMPNIVKAIEAHGSAELKQKHAATLANYDQSIDYTADLVALVEGFQDEKGLKPDGIIGKASVKALLGGGDDNASKINKLIVAMEQLRWLPKELGSRYVFINQPAFMVYYHNDNKEQLSMRVVVGGKNHQTFFFQDEIETVEFNPFWGVPQSIIVNEMLPKLRADPNYLDRMGYDVELNGRSVSSSSVNWYGSTAGVSVRQPPSDDNALGELKILFPNAHAIYMHDTPSKSFFKRDMRALSHGCVRLSDPRTMAAAVLNTSIEEVAKKIATGKNSATPVPSRIPIYVSYFTAWPNKDGVVEYFDDVYERDAYMQKAFEATSKVRGAQI